MTSSSDTTSLYYDQALESQRLAPHHAKRAQNYRSATIYLILIANLAAVVAGCAYVHGLNTIGSQILFYGSAGTGGTAMVTAWGTLTGRAVHSYLAAKHRRRYERQKGDLSKQDSEFIQNLTSEDYTKILTDSTRDPLTFFQLLWKLDQNREELIHHTLFLSSSEFNNFWGNLRDNSQEKYRKMVKEKVDDILQYYECTNSKADSQEFYHRFYQLVGQTFGGKQTEISMRFWEPERREAALRFYHKKRVTFLEILKIINIENYGDFEKLFNKAEESRKLPEYPPRKNEYEYEEA